MTDDSPEGPRDLDLSTWERLESTLAECLASLEPGHFVTLAAPSTSSETASASQGGERQGGLLRRLLGRSEGESGAFVQAQPFADGTLHVECVGSTSFGGRHNWSSEAERQLEALGWAHDPEVPGEKVYVLVPPGLPAAAAARPAARAMIATLRDVAATSSPDRLAVNLA